MKHVATNVKRRSLLSMNDICKAKVCREVAPHHDNKEETHTECSRERLNGIFVLESQCFQYASVGGDLFLRRNGVFVLQGVRSPDDVASRRTCSNIRPAKITGATLRPGRCHRNEDKRKRPSQSSNRWNSDAQERRAVQCYSMCVCVCQVAGRVLTQRWIRCTLQPFVPGDVNGRHGSDLSNLRPG